MHVKARAHFEDNDDNQMGFYGMEGEPHRRIKDGQEFTFDFDDSKHEFRDIQGRIMIGRTVKTKHGEVFNPSWIELLEKPKKTISRKKKSESIGDQDIVDVDSDVLTA